MLGLAAVCRLSLVVARVGLLPFVAVAQALGPQAPVVASLRFRNCILRA